MRILAYTHQHVGSGHIAGSESSLHDLCLILKGFGHDVGVLLGEPAKNGRGNYTQDGIPVFVPMDDKDSRFFPQQMFPLTDVIITQNKFSERGGILGRMLKKPVVHYVHNDADWTKKMVAQRTDLAIYNTEWVKEEFESEGIDTPGIVLHPPVDPERYRVRRNRGSKYITLVNLSKGDSFVSYDKGWRTFFELARRNPDESFLGVHGAYGNQATSDLPNITYMDHTEDIREAFKKSRVVVVPSEYESFGRVAVEAAASGIPSILTGTDGTYEAMGDSAQYLPFGRYDAWDMVLKETLANYTYFSDRARRRSEYCWERTQSEIETLRDTFQGLVRR